MVKNKGISIGVMIFVVLIVAYITAWAVAIPMMESGNDNDLRISQETGNELCVAVTGNESSIAQDSWDYQGEDDRIEKGKLVCELPSYDSTHNIVIKMNNK